MNKKLLSYLSALILLASCNEAGKLAPSKTKHPVKVESLDITIDEQGTAYFALHAKREYSPEPAARTVGAGVVADILEIFVKPLNHEPIAKVLVNEARPQSPREAIRVIGIASSSDFKSSSLLIDTPVSLSLFWGDSSSEEMNAYVLKKEEGGRHTPFQNKMSAITSSSEGSYLVGTMDQAVDSSEFNLELLKVLNGKVENMKRIRVNSSLSGRFSHNGRAKISAAGEMVSFAAQPFEEEKTLVAKIIMDRDTGRSKGFELDGFPLAIWTNGREVRTATKRSDCIAALYSEESPVFKEQTQLGSCTAIKFTKEGNALMVNFARDLSPEGKERGITINTTHVEYDSARTSKKYSTAYGDYLPAHSKCAADIDREGNIHAVFISHNGDCNDADKVAGSPLCDLDRDGFADLKLNYIVLSPEGKVISHHTPKNIVGNIR